MITLFQFRTQSGRKGGAGFTLIELLATISIIAFLATLLMVNLDNARGKARDARRIADMHTIRQGLDLYYDTHESYPPSDTGVGFLPGSGREGLADRLFGAPTAFAQGAGNYIILTDASWVLSDNGFTPADQAEGSLYLSRMPIDPVNNAETTQIYVYRQYDLGGTPDFGITYTIEEGTADISVGTHVASSGGFTGGPGWTTGDDVCEPGEYSSDPSEQAYCQSLFGCRTGVVCADGCNVTGGQAPNCSSTDYCYSGPDCGMPKLVPCTCEAGVCVGNPLGGVCPP